MITITYKTLNSEGFSRNLAFLASQKDFGSFQAAYNVSKIVRKFDKELNQARDMYKTITKDFLETDEKGQLIAAEIPHPTCPWKIKEGMTEKFDLAMEDFLAVKFEIQVPKLTFQDLGQVKLTPVQMNELEPILSLED